MPGWRRLSGLRFALMSAGRPLSPPHNTECLRKIHRSSFLTMPKPKLNAREITRDIRSGLDDAGLMKKYLLSAPDLLNLFNKLVQAGLMTQSEMDERTPAYERTVEITYDFLKDLQDADKKPIVTKKTESAPKTSLPTGEEDPIIEAARNGNIRALEACMTAGTSVNYRGKWGMTPLMWAAAKGHVPAVGRLISKGAQVNGRANNRSTALMWACFGGHYDVAELLIRMGAEVNAQSNQGRTALMSVCFKGHQKIAELLLAKGADKEIRDNSGKPAREYVRAAKHPALAKLLSTRK
jgi:uncharacterized protein